MNEFIKRKLIEEKWPSKSIEQWYKQATNLNIYWRESRRKEERLRGRREVEAQAPVLNSPTDAVKA